MRVNAVTAGILVTTALLSMNVLGTRPAHAAVRKVTCLCGCPDDHKARKVERAVPRRVARRAVRPLYDYAAAAPVSPVWHGEWRVAPNDGAVPAPAYMPSPQAANTPQPGYDPPADGIPVDQRGWNGGVGYRAEGGGGGGGGFVDGFGQIHFGQGGNQENGPTYNSYNQSFQYNPSVAAPFQPRLMGGVAPSK